MENMLNSALSLAKRGFMLTPCMPNRVETLSYQFRTNASREPVILKQWFGDNDFNIGIITGADSGVFVVTVEPDSIDEFKGRGQIPATLTQISPTGAMMYFFVYTGRIRTKLRGLWPNKLGRSAYHKKMKIVAYSLNLEDHND